MTDELVEELYNEILERNHIKRSSKPNSRETYKPKDSRFGEGIGFQRLRRITGYLVGTVDRWNNGKLAELKDRTINT